MTARVDVEAFVRFSEACPHRREAPLERRPANALNVEIGAPAPGCALKPPKHWPEGMVGRWLASGGSPLVLGACSRNCALGHAWCACGHRRESHDLRREDPACAVAGCACQAFNDPRSDLTCSGPVARGGTPPAAAHASNGPDGDQLRRSPT